MVDIKKILSNTSFWCVNKHIVHELNSRDAAILLADLIDKFDYFLSKNECIEIDGEKYFFSTAKQIEKSLLMKRSPREKCTKILIDKGLIKTKLIGMPQKMYFSIDQNNVIKLLQKKIKGI